MSDSNSGKQHPPAPSIGGNVVPHEEVDDDASPGVTSQRIVGGVANGGGGDGARGDGREEEAAHADPPPGILRLGLFVPNQDRDRATPLANNDVDADRPNENKTISELSGSADAAALVLPNLKDQMRGAAEGNRADNNEPDGQDGKEPIVRVDDDVDSSNNDHKHRRGGHPDGRRERGGGQDDAVDVMAEEMTIPVVAAAYCTTDRDRREAQVRAVEERAAAAEAGRRDVEEQLSSWCGGLMAKLSWWQRVLVTICVIVGLVLAVTAITIGITSTRPEEKKRDNPMNNDDDAVVGPVVNNSTTLSVREQSILDYINSITLTGRTLTYPDPTTAEGRALAWLMTLDFDDDNYKNGAANVTTAVNNVTTNDLVLLRQRYALATLWFQTPTHFALRPSAGNTWGTSVNVCEWTDVYCDNRYLVENLQFSSVGLQGGHIPADLGLLTSLTVLDLTSNKLAGTIPSSLGYLTLLGLWHCNTMIFLAPFPQRWDR
jgi:hypothetical protein